MSERGWEVLVVERATGRILEGPFACPTEERAAREIQLRERCHWPVPVDVCCQRAAAEPPACCGDEPPAYSGDPDGVDLSA